MKVIEAEFFMFVSSFFPPFSLFSVLEMESRALNLLGKYTTTVIGSELHSEYDMI